MILIADSGSTKTAWCLADSKSTNTQKIFHTQGINPFQQSEGEICEVLENELLPSLPHPFPDINGIFFYGAGCTAEKSPIVAKALRSVVSRDARIMVESDMLGAARGLCGSSEGIVCILGTGSNTCYYDGRDMHTCNPALGYILGDEGSGAYIGKRLVGDILKRQLPKSVQDLFFEETKESQATIIQKVYREQLPNRFLASLSPFCARHRDIPEVSALIKDCFSEFFKRNILVMKSDFNIDSRIVNFVGSVAYYYQQELKEVANTFGYEIGNIKQAPLEGLVDFHVQK
ncbi:MAG: ATPase [Bacteroidaceae bacterium]|nr:ATPase [Bacteroidaceae bacterium]